MTPDEDEEVADVPGPSMQEDVAEQKELIAKLKAEKSKAQTHTQAKEEQQDEAGPSAVPLKQSDSTGSKRSRDEEEEEKPLQFKFREPGEAVDVAKREIRSNRRVSLTDLEPQQKSAAWGALWFAAGLAAA